MIYLYDEMVEKANDVLVPRPHPSVCRPIVPIVTSSQYPFDTSFDVSNPFPILTPFM